MRTYLLICAMFFIILWKPIAGAPSHSNIMKKYNRLIEHPTCISFNYNDSSVMLDHGKLIVSELSIGEEITNFKVKVDLDKPLELLAVFKRIKSFRGAFIDTLETIVPRQNNPKLILLFSYNRYINLLLIKEEKTKRDVLILHINPKVLIPRKLIPGGTPSVLNCKKILPKTMFRDQWNNKSLDSYSLKERVKHIVPTMRYVDLKPGSALLIQDRGNGLRCHRLYNMPQTLPVTWINNIDFSYSNGAIDLHKLRDINPNNYQPYYYGFNLDLSQIFFATSFGYLEENVPNWYHPGWLNNNNKDNTWHPFLFSNFIYIISGEWVFYFLYLDHYDWKLGERDLIAAPLSIIHINQFFRCAPGGERMVHSFPAQNYSYLIHPRRG